MRQPWVLKNYKLMVEKTKDFKTPEEHIIGFLVVDKMPSLIVMTFCFWRTDFSYFIEKGERKAITILVGEVIKQKGLSK